MSTTSTPAENRRLLYWQVLVGGQRREDEALLRVVGPAVAASIDPDRSWHFLRYFDERGAHLRVRVHTDELRPSEVAELDDALAAALEGRLAAFLEDPGDQSPEPLYAKPPHHDFGGRGAGVHAACYERELEKYGNAAGVRVAEDVWTASSRAALHLLPGVRHDQARRVATAALLCQEAVELFAEYRELDSQVFWTRYGLYWSGGHNDWGRTRLRDTAADERVPDLVELAGLPRPRAPELADAVARGCLRGEEVGGVTAEALLFHHLHLANNRLGVIPVEEPLIAVIALHLRRRATTRH